ncbi:MAG: phenylacetate-CoA oxygenase subunit PaaI, partial [Cellvibrionaceae bacterium]|nr:phenylacetate-CoA oxygenase subunit PaaI [Cellvibrionaceae bacterium]
NAEWVKRLGDGTEESHQRMVAALNETSRFINEMFEMDEVDQMMVDAGIGVDLNMVKAKWEETVDAVLTEATLSRPTPEYDRRGGRQGVHTEQLGFILAEMQYVQRCHPGLSW